MIVRLLPLLMMISVFSGNSSMASPLTRNRGNNLSPIKLDQEWNTALPLSSVTCMNFDPTADAMYIRNTGCTLCLTGKWPKGKTPAVLFCESGHRFDFFELHLHWSHHLNKSTDHVIYSERNDIELHAVFRNVAGGGDSKHLSYSKLYKVGVVPFTKLLDPAQTSQTFAGNKDNMSRSKESSTSEEKSRRGTDRSPRGQEQRTEPSDSTASTKESRETQNDEVYNKDFGAEMPDKSTPSWSAQTQSSLDSKLKSSNTSAELPHLEEDRKHSDMPSEHSRSKEGDQTAELSRRRAERLTKVGSLREILPARLVKSAFEDAVGLKNLKKIDRNEKHDTAKKSDPIEGSEKSDGRRILVVNSTAVERHISSISVTIPKDK